VPGLPGLRLVGWKPSVEVNNDTDARFQYDGSTMADIDGSQATVTLYRLVQTDPPTVRDFLSQKVLGIPLKHETAKVLRLWDGLSVYRTMEQARTRASQTPRLGRYIAELTVPLDDDRIVVELDNGRNGHCTVWGSPWLFRSFVVSVTPV
jgi:hypothetical protein